MALPAGPINEPAKLLLTKNLIDNFKFDWDIFVFVLMVLDFIVGVVMENEREILCSIIQVTKIKQNVYEEFVNKKDQDSTMLVKFR